MPGRAHQFPSSIFGLLCRCAISVNLAGSRFSISGAPGLHVVSGPSHCQLVGAGGCVTDGAGPYRTGDRCEVEVRRPGFLSAYQFNLGTGVVVTIGGANNSDGPGKQVERYCWRALF